MCLVTLCSLSNTYTVSASHIPNVIALLLLSINDFTFKYIRLTHIIVYSIPLSSLPCLFSLTSHILNTIPLSLPSFNIPHLNILFRCIHIILPFLSPSPLFPGRPPSASLSPRGLGAGKVEGNRTVYHWLAFPGTPEALHLLRNSSLVFPFPRFLTSLLIHQLTKMIQLTYIFRRGLT